MTLLTEPAIVLSTKQLEHLYAFAVATARGEITCPRQYGGAKRPSHVVLVLF
jgi:hypothetical protein